MYLTRRLVRGQARWALDGAALPAAFDLRLLTQITRSNVAALLAALPRGEDLQVAVSLPPIEPDQEVWAAGVTYSRSRDARQVESDVADVYEKVYEASRPELFFKSIGHRVVGDGANIRVRRDASWSVPEPELCLLLNSAMEVVGYCAGNDVSSRDIEGENPLYLPQAKVYDGSCALGPGLVLLEVDEPLPALDIRLAISRGGVKVFDQTISTDAMKRTPGELVSFLGRELAFPNGVFLMTGTGLVPPDEFTLLPDDEVLVQVGDVSLTNTVAR